MVASCRRVYKGIAHEGNSDAINTECTFDVDSAQVLHFWC